MAVNPNTNDATACDSVFIQTLTSKTYLAPDTLRNTTLWISLRGTFAVETQFGPFVLDRRQYLTLPHDYRPNLLSGEDFLGILVTLPHPQPAKRSRGTPAPVSHHEVFAVRGTANAALLNSAIRLLRRKDKAGLEQTTFQAHRLLSEAQACQPDVRTWLDRAPGRTRAHRRTALQRLLYARNMILNRPFDENMLSDLADAARYSKSHFVTTFRDVFGETPGALHVQARIAMAQILMSQSGLAGCGLSVGEIAADVGYGSRSAFSRMFKNRVGVNASTYMKRPIVRTSPTTDASEAIAMP